MTPWPTAHIEYSHTRRKMQFRDDEVDLLTRPLRERIPQVRRPQMVCNGFEPMVGHLFSLRPRMTPCRVHFKRDFQFSGVTHDVENKFIHHFLFRSWCFNNHFVVNLKD